MNDLTDLEICTRIAEINGDKPTHNMDIEFGDDHLYLELDNDEYTNYRNPLTDDALCFNIAFTHKVKIDYFDECVYIALKRKLTRQLFNKNDISSLRKAICLAIIKAHDE